MNIRIIPFFLILIIWGCTNLEFSRQYQPQEFQVLQEFDLDFVPDKCIYLDVDNILFALQKNSNQIYIFRDGAQINIIGGIGSEAAKFNQLCDIALSPDGKLLALDSFQKKIKKFDKDGKCKCISPF